MQNKLYVVSESGEMVVDWNELRVISNCQFVRDVKYWLNDDKGTKWAYVLKEIRDLSIGERGLVKVYLYCEYLNSTRILTFFQRDGEEAEISKMAVQEEDLQTMKKFARWEKL